MKKLDKWAPHGLTKVSVGYLLKKAHPTWNAQKYPRFYTFSFNEQKFESKDLKEFYFQVKIQTKQLYLHCVMREMLLLREKIGLCYGKNNNISQKRGNKTVGHTKNKVKYLLIPDLDTQTFFLLH